jgi:hypothetical protein
MNRDKEIVTCKKQIKVQESLAYGEAKFLWFVAKNPRTESGD